jgi:putative ABC transport system substrate-binding protein
VEGKNIVIEYRYAEGKLDRLPRWLPNWLTSQNRCHCNWGNQATRRQKRPARSLSLSDPLATFVQLESPPAWRTLAGMSPVRRASLRILEGTTEDIEGKSAEGFAGRCYFISSKRCLARPRRSRTDGNCGEGLGDNNPTYPSRSSDEFRDAYAVIQKDHADALVILQSSLTFINRNQIFDFAKKRHIASMCEALLWTENGCLMSYGPDLPSQYHRAGFFVDKILKGTHPGDIPVESPAKFDFIINLKAENRSVWRSRRTCWRERIG